MAAKRKGCLIAVLVVLVLVVGFVCLLPALLSTKPVSGMIFAKVKTASGDKVSIESWSLGWFSGIKVSGIKFQDKVAGTTVDITSVDTPAGILSMLKGARKNFGHIKVMNPRVCVILPTPVEAARKIGEPAMVPEAPARPEKPVPAGPPKPVKVPVDVQGIVEICGGSVQVKSPDESASLDVSDLNVTVTIESLNKPIAFKVSEKLAGGESELTGTTTLLTDGMLDVNRVAADVTLKIRALQLAALTAPFASLPGMPQVSGALSVDLSTAVRGPKDIAASGKIGLQALALSGGPLGEDKPSFDNTSLEFACSLKDNLVKVDRFSLASPVASASASGTIGLPAPGETGTLPAAAFETTSHVDIPALASRFAHTMKLQEGLVIKKGGVDVKARIASDGRKQSVDANVAVKDLAAVMNGKEIAMAEPILLAAQVSMEGKNVLLENVTLSSAFAKARVTGTPHEVKAALEADIAAALAEAGKFVALPPGLNVEGRTEVQADVVTSGKVVKVAANVALKGLAATVNGQRGEMSAPVLVNCNVVKDGADLTVDDVSLSSSFANAKITGTQKDLKINANVNLGAAVAEARKFTAIPTNAGVEGTAQLEARLGIDGDKLALSSSVALNNIVGIVNGRRGELAKPVLLTCKINKAGEDLSIDDLTFASSFADAKVSGTQKNLKINASADIGAAMAEARKFAELPADINVEGKAELASVLRQSSGGDMAFSADMALKGVAGTVKGRRAELAAPILMTCKVSTRDKAVQVDNFEFSSSFAKAKVTGNAKEMKIDASADIAAALAEARKLADIPADLKVAGEAVASTVIATEGRIVRITSTGDFKSFAFEKGSKKLTEKLLHTGLACDIDLEKKGVILKSAELTSSPLSVKAAGTFQKWDTSRDLAASGELSCDVGRMAEIAAAMTGMKVTGAGKKAEPFRIRTSLAGKKWTDILAATDMSAALYAEKLEAFGVKIGETHVPLTVSNSVARLRIESTVNEGKVLAEPIVDARKDTPILTMPPDSKLLDGLSITDAMVDNILVRIHPFFAACVITSGKMSLDMKRLRVPLDDQLMKKAAFEGQVSLAALSLKASGLLEQVALLMGESAQDAMSLGDMAFGFACRDGRLYPDPIKVKIGSEKVVFRGSVGLDQSLDYYVDIPITKGMVPAKAYPYLKDESISVPIGGTATKPKLADNAVQKILGDLVTKALEKAAKKELEKQATKLIDGLFK